MNWAHSLELLCALVAIATLVMTLPTPHEWPRHRHNRFHRGTLPPPSDKCRREGVEAVTH